MLPPIVHIRKESDKAAMRWSLERMMQELREPQPGGFLVAQHLAHMMLVQALRLHLAEGLRGGVGWLFALADKQMSAAINAMHDDPAHRWTLQELAERAGMSRSTFALKFKETVGESPMEYLTRWRMLLAGDKLANSSDPISVIALSLGYESESAFSTAFKRVMGCSPRQYSRGPNPASPSHSEGKPPAPIGSNLSQVDMRGWRRSKHPIPFDSGGIPRHALIWAKTLSGLPRDYRQKRLGCGGRRCGILSGNETTIDERKGLPIGCFFIEAAHSLQLILDKERHNMGEVNCFLFAVGETRHALTLHKRSALVGHPMEYIYRTNLPLYPAIQAYFRDRQAAHPHDIAGLHVG